MIGVLRSILCVMCFVLFGIGALGMGGLLFPIMLLVYGKPARQRRFFARSIHISWRFFVWVMVHVGLISIKCDKMDALRGAHGRIIVANHPSLIDVVILVAIIPNCVCVVKKGLFRNIFIKNVIKNIYLPNDMSVKSFVERAGAMLREGYNVLIFPEGTRTIPGVVPRIHRGFAYLHIRSQMPILPINITNNPAILGKKQKWYDVGNKTVRYTLNVMSEIVCHNNMDDGERVVVRRVADLTAKKIFGPYTA